MKKLALHWKILIALILAFSIGLWANFSTETSTEKPAWFGNLHYFSNFVGSLFLNALKMVVIPLVMTSIICGVAKIGEDKDFGRLGIKTLLFYSLTGLLAVIVGLLCVNLIEPGQVDADLRDRMLAGQTSMESEKMERAFQHADGGLKGILEIFQRMIPQNLFKAAVEGQLLGLIFFSLLFGFFVARLPKKLNESQTAFWEGLNTAILSITNFVISFAPYGVFGLVTPTLMMVGIETIFVMGTFASTVLLGLAIHSFVVLPLLLHFLGKISFFKHFQALSPALLTAFSTASSSATLPVTLDCITKRAGVSKKIASFTLPLGATMNMDGTALFECVVVVFLAQLFGVEMTWVTQSTVVVMALLTSIGVAGIPSASLVAIIVILHAVGFSEATISIGVGVVFVVDRILDMTRTAVNVLGDSCAAAIIGKSEGETGYYADPRG
jgi:Na+/H+-dicarboxylate symporter